MMHRRDPHAPFAARHAAIVTCAHSTQNQATCNNVAGHGAIPAETYRHPYRSVHDRPLRSNVAAHAWAYMPYGNTVRKNVAPYIPQQRLRAHGGRVGANRRRGR